MKAGLTAEEDEMATLLESGARPYGSGKGIAISMLVHGAIITAAVVGTATVVLPPREKVEEHPVLYVASPPPKPVVAPDPLPKVKEAPRVAKAPAAPRREQAPQPRVTPQPQLARATPALVAPPKIPSSVPAIDLKVAATVSDVVGAAVSDKIASSSGGVSRQGSVRGAEGDEGGFSGKGIGSGSGRAYTENQVDRAVEAIRLPEPRYPEALKSVGVEGVVVMRFIVGTDGRVEAGSIETVSTPHRLFADAVRTALLNTKFRPAEAGGRPVRQLAEQSFTFKIQK